ncbi:GNAT family N-acetyltransferase, partial [Clavibacter michiganensis]
MSGEPTGAYASAAAVSAMDLRAAAALLDDLADR